VCVMCNVNLHKEKSNFFEKDGVIYYTKREGRGE
jgi:hypothetical protein